MKKTISIILIMLFILTMLVGCNKKENSKDDNKISIVTTIFPEYDWVKTITKGNDNIEVTMLLDDGVDLHSFQPTADDILKVTSSDMFIYVGGESDEWVEDALKESSNKDTVVINLLDVLGDSIKEEEVVEGMESEEEEEGEGEEEPEYDEHVWLSLKNAKTLCKYISDELCKIDTTNKELYKKNTEEYISELEMLDQEYEKATEQAAIKTVLFGDRFPFRYMMDDYGINYYAAFVGCSAESEASFETISFLAKKIDELKLPAIIKLESSDGKIADTIKKNTKNKNQQILTMDSLQSTTSKDISNGVTYLETMKTNLEILKQAIN